MSQEKKYKLFEKLAEFSQNKNKYSAASEWKLDSVVNSNDFETCVCGHFPIKKLCFIKNKWNGNELIVGSCCVKRINPNWDKVFDGMDKIRINNWLSVNTETLFFAKDKEIITEWEFNFYLDICRKRNLSEKQLEIKIRINEKLLLNIQKC